MTLSNSSAASSESSTSVIPQALMIRRASRNTHATAPSPSLPDSIRIRGTACQLSSNFPPALGTRTCSRCSKEDAPTITESPCSRLRRLWCESQRKATSESVSSCFFATCSMEASALKYVSFQYRLRKACSRRNDGSERIGTGEGSVVGSTHHAHHSRRVEPRTGLRFVLYRVISAREEPAAN